VTGRVPAGDAVGGEPPRRIADLRPGGLLVDAASGTVWTIEEVRRANTYATPWVHLVAPDGSRRVESAGTLICEPGDEPRWRAAAEGVASG
jgi:hypothetical protein